ncbi:MAG TPA: hypothetical protein VGF52_06240 [Tepidisphaeraceae bacterium]
MIRSGFALFAVALFGGILTAPAQASVLTPGPGASPPDIFIPVGATLLASNNSGTVTSSSGTLIFDMASAVYSDPSNTFGAGDLDFMYQVATSASSLDSIERVTAINFTGFLTDVGYTPTGSSLPGGLFVDGSAAPELVDRVLPGDVVGFSFNAPLTLPVTPGQTSTVLMIETDATNFTTGHVNVTDGGVSTVDAFQPAPAPEPAGMLAMSLLLAGFARRRRA